MDVVGTGAGLTEPVVVEGLVGGFVPPPPQDVKANTKKVPPRVPWRVQVQARGCWVGFKLKPSVGCDMVGCKRDGFAP